MILKQLVLHNVGVYRGRHTIELAPPSRKRPVILFGGLNGGGKTTILDALQLALYGRMAQCSNRGELAYDEFLRRSIHRGVDGRDGAAIELTLTQTIDGEPHVYQVRRSWSVREKHVRDRVEVYRDDSYDELLTDSWAEHIEEMLPVRLSKFFFFDGEKIEALADPERSSDALSTAIHALLGLDIVDQLATDLTVLERRKRTLQRSAPEREAIEAAKQEVDRLEARRDDLVTERAAAQNAVDRAERAAREADERFKLGGGDVFEHRREVEAREKAVKEQLHRLEEELRDEADGAAPLMLVTELLDQVHADDISEQARGEARALGTMLEERDSRALKAAESSGASRKVLDALAELFTADRRRYEGAAAASAYLGLTTEARQMLGTVREALRAETPGRIRRRLEDASRLIDEIDNIDRKLASVPAEDTIADLAEKRSQTRAELERARVTLQALEADLDRTKREHEHRWDQYSRRMKEDVDEQVEQQTITRVITHAERVRDTMARFRSEVLKRRVHRIEELVLESFRFLLRKESLVAGLHIDPKTFAMTLAAPDGRALSPERLSAGERQLLAVSTIWGIARASGRPLPVVIDTPLGRLDSVHRHHLLERYFPLASHQVILLSTDKEIDEANYERLKPSIGRVYTLRFDDKTASTTVEPGYFW